MMSMIIDVMTASIPGLQLIAFMALLAVVVLASLMFFVEAGDYVPPGTSIELEGGCGGELGLGPGRV